MSNSLPSKRTAEDLTVLEYDPEWSMRFAELGGGLRSALGEVALRIDHIGSTAVPGLAAKPIIDVQISVASLEPVDRFRASLEGCGFVWRPDNTERTKRYFRERPGDRRTHVHVRRAGSFSEQFALLFRDYLRGHPDAAAEYGARKRELADLLATDRHTYTDAKAPIVWRIIQQADEWAQRTGWQPPRSDM